MIRRYTVIGNPIEHSQSPQIHALFAEQTHREIDYTRTLATAENFGSTVAEFVQLGGHGCNITAPFKELALSLCDQLSPAATRANAVNTLRINENKSITGHNTDGCGLLTDLQENHKLALASARILIAGAGGATRGILLPLLQQQPAQLVVANRTLSRATRLANDFADCGQVTSCNYDTIPAGEFDLIINATSLGLQDEKPPLPVTCVGQSSTAYELSYGKQTPFMQWCSAVGAGTVLDGFGMLLEQAADAFFLWEEVRPKTRLILPRL